MTLNGSADSLNESDPGSRLQDVPGEGESGNGLAAAHYGSCF